MGTSASVIVHGGDASADRVFERIGELEACWTRFRPDSELSRANAASGRLTVVSPELLRLVEYLDAARRLTGGRFDPTLHDALVALGYDRTYQELTPTSIPTRIPAPAPAPHPGAAQEPRAAQPTGPGAERAIRPAGRIEVFHAVSTILIEAGTHLDPGGLGKGLAGDMVVDEAMGSGAIGALVEIGGDVVCRGSAPDGGPWRVTVPQVGGQPERILELRGGAVATSDTTTRTWTKDGHDVHHLLDPLTGVPVPGEITATVVAGAGWWAEAVATAAIVSVARGDGWFDSDRARELGVTAFVAEREPAHA